MRRDAPVDTRRIRQIPAGTTIRALSLTSPASMPGFLARNLMKCASQYEGGGNYPPLSFERRVCGLVLAQARMLTITLKGFAALSLAVSMVVRTSASASAAHIAR